ncbi:MAG: histidine--tRNA ligase [Candidatus Aminicenantes bacterium]|nr:histidine--tRNA ligase [Candidatus Aminicenantes bacterium]
MKKQIAAIKGTKDILPREAKKWQQVEAVIKRVLELYAYKEIRTPIFEATELFEKGTGQTTDIVIKEMYTFKDKAGRSLTLRPEYTPSVARSIIENRLYLQPEPLRFYYIGPMFRYDKPQKGRYRQFHQVDIEVFGEKDPALDAEIVEMANYLLRELKVRGTENLVNSVGCKKCRPSYIKDLRSRAEKVIDDLCKDCKRKVELNPLRIFDCKIETCREAAKTFPKITDYLCQECKEHFNRFCDYLAFYGIKYRIEPRLVRGIDYYTKTTFEIVSSKLGAQNAIIGGGRYDDMMKEFGGPDICAIGFALGLERLISVVPFKEEKGEFLYLTYLGDESKRVGMKAVQFLRKEGVECLIEYKERSIKSQMSRANKLGAAWVLIIGEEEVKEKKYKLKNMASGLQVEGTQDEILKIIRESS